MLAFRDCTRDRASALALAATDGGSEYLHGILYEAGPQYYGIPLDIGCLVFTLLAPNQMHDFLMAIKEASEGSGRLGSVGEFLELIGVDFRSNPWEGSLISGVYRFGWVKVSTVRAVRKKTAELLKALQRQVDSEVRRTILEELAGIKGIDRLIERTAADRDVLRRQILESKSADELGLTRDRLQQLEASDSKQIDESCLRMAGAILRRAPCRMVAGPLVLWDDNVVYAITSRGGVTLPANSTPAILLGDLEAAGYPVVRVEEKTVIGGWTSGPIYRKGTPHITGWVSVWSDRERKERVLSVVPKDSERKVHEIHRTLASGSSGASK